MWFKEHKEIIAALIGTFGAIAAALLTAIIISNKNLEGIKKSNEMHLQAVRETINSQLKNVMATNENTLKAIKLDNELKETCTYKHEQRNKEMETFESARILVSDIYVRIKVLKGAVEKLQTLVQSSESEVFLISLAEAVSMIKSNISFKVDQEFYMNKSKLLPDELAKNVISFYRYVVIWSSKNGHSVKLPLPR